jgi:hypothetical protein
MAELNRIFLFLAAATVGLYLIMAGLGVFLYIDAQHERQNLANQIAAQENTRIALCAFKKDLARRARDTEQFIADVQAGRRKPIPGISLADFQRSLRGQRSTIKSLSDLPCN